MTPFFHATFRSVPPDYQRGQMLMTAQLVIRKVGARLNVESPVQQSRGNAERVIKAANQQSCRCGFLDEMVNPNPLPLFVFGHEPPQHIESTARRAWELIAVVYFADAVL